jgi:hypothetical protein
VWKKIPMVNRAFSTIYIRKLSIATLSGKSASRHWNSRESATVCSYLSVNNA